MLNVGDRVIAIKNYGRGHIIDLKARIVAVRENGYSLEFDEWIGGHTCDGLAKPGHGWNVPKDWLVLDKPLDEVVKVYTFGEE